MNVAVLVEGGLVEVVQATALLRTLEDAGEDMVVTLCAPPSAAELVGTLPGVAEVVFLPALRHGAPARQLLGDWRRLRRHRFDAALLCGRSTRLRWLAHLTGSPQRIGPGGGLTAWLLDRRVEAEHGENHAAVWLRSATELGITRLHPELSFDPGDAPRRVASEVLTRGGLATGTTLLALAPGSAWLDSAPAPARELHWPPQRFAYVANQLHQRHGLSAVLLGSPDDAWVGEYLRPDLALPHLDLCGGLSLREAAAVIERCDLFVGNDSPLLQLAAALHVPALGVFGASDGHTRGPWGIDQRAVQALRRSPERRRHVENVEQERRNPLIHRVRVDDVVAWIEARDAA